MPPTLTTRGFTGLQPSGMARPLVEQLGQQVDIPDVPLEERLRPQGSFHSELVARLVSRRELARTSIERRYDDWNRVDEHVRLFIDLSRRAKDADNQTNPNMLEMPFRRAIVVPMSYSILQVRLTQLMGIFFAREPFLQVSGRGPEDERPSRLMEATLAYDTLQSNMTYWFYSFLQDTEKYGVSIMYDVWAEEKGWKTIKPTPPPGMPPELFAKMVEVMGIEGKETWDVVKEYNKWESIDPFLYWPDPRVPFSDVQRGEFVGHRVFRPWTFLYERSQKLGGPYFNVEFLGQSGVYARDRTVASRDQKMLSQFTLKSAADEKDRGYFTVDHMQVKLIPRDWKLSESDKPEIWWFTWVDDSVIIRAHKSSYEHQQFTYSVGESNPDPHALFNPGSIENLDGLQRFTNWMLNSHLQNLMKFLNDSMIYPPSLIEEGDLLNPGPARHIRLTQKGEELLLKGRLKLPEMVQQLQLTDVTQPHLNAVQYLMQMAQMMTAANDQTTGMKSSGSKGRQTLGEIQRLVYSASQRVSTTARILDAMAIQPLATRAIANRQQFTSVNQYYRIVGRLVQAMGGLDRTLIKPNDIRGNFDYIPHSGAQPPDPAKNADVWMKALEMISKFPALAQTGPDGRALDVREIFNQVIRNGGAPNIDSFYIRVMPDGQVQKEYEQGNLIPDEQTPQPGFRNRPMGKLSPTFGTSNESTVTM